jgi:RNA polymerase sigma factor (sigma-70 family)
MFAPLRVSSLISPCTSVGEDAVLTDPAATRLAVEKLYRDEGPKLWRSVMSFTAERSIADDAVAEAFAQLLGRGDAVKDPTAWVWKASFRIAAGEMQDKRRRNHSTAEVAAYELPDPLPELLAGLAALPATQRIVIVMHDYADRPSAEIAQVLGITNSTVRVHLSLARRRLRKALGDLR